MWRAFTVYFSIGVLLLVLGSSLSDYAIRLVVLLETAPLAFFLFESSLKYYFMGGRNSVSFQSLLIYFSLFLVLTGSVFFALIETLDLDYTSAVLLFIFFFVFHCTSFLHGYFLENGVHSGLVVRENVMPWFKIVLLLSACFLLDYLIFVLLVLILILVFVALYLLACARSAGFTIDKKTNIHDELKSITSFGVKSSVGGGLNQLYHRIWILLLVDHPTIQELLLIYKVITLSSLITFFRVKQISEKFSTSILAGWGVVLKEAFLQLSLAFFVFIGMWYVSHYFNFPAYRGVLESVWLEVPLILGLFLISPFMSILHFLIQKKGSGDVLSLWANFIAVISSLVFFYVVDVFPFYLVLCGEISAMCFVVIYWFRLYKKII